jgi:hypothetical protein
MDLPASRVLGACAALAALAGTSACSYAFVRHPGLGVRASYTQVAAAGESATIVVAAPTSNEVVVVEGGAQASGSIVIDGSAAGGSSVDRGSAVATGAADRSSSAVIVDARGGASEIVATSREASGGMSIEGADHTASGVGVGAGSVAIDGSGRGLLSVVRQGVTVDGRIVALDLLTPLADRSFSADARVGGDASITIDAALGHDALPAAGEATEVVIRVAGGRAPQATPPLRIHLVIDASTSMASTWHHLEDAALDLIARLRPDDELQIVVYGISAREALAASRVGDGSSARRVIRAIRPEGRTNIEAGLRIAYRAVRPHASIVLLLSDGVPNGGLSDEAELGALAAEASARGAVTTAIGIGWDFHPGVLRAIAEQGHGGFRIAPRPSELGALLEAELTARGRIAAHDIAVEVRLAPGVQLAGDLPAGVVAIEGGVSLSLPSITTGEESVIVVPVSLPRGADARSVATVDARWTPFGGRAAHGDKSLRIATAPRPILAGGALAVLDADLARAIAISARAVTNGDADRAATALRDHVARARIHLSARPDAELALRFDHALRIATALEARVRAASWHDRRATGATMLSFAASFGAR